MRIETIERALDFIARALISIGGILVFIATLFAITILS